MLDPPIEAQPQFLRDRSEKVELTLKAMLGCTRSHHVPTMFPVPIMDKPL